MKLPIELVPNSQPPKFRWWSHLKSLDGKVLSTPQEGSLPPVVESAVRELIQLCKLKCDEVEQLRKRVATLEGSTEKPPVQPTPTETKRPTKRGK